jgi:hypothetical protein
VIARGQVVAQGGCGSVICWEHPHHVRVVCDGRAARRGDPQVEGVLSVRFPFARGRVRDARSRQDLRGDRRRNRQGAWVQSLTSPMRRWALFHYLVERSGRVAGTGAGGDGRPARSSAGRGRRRQKAGKAKEART